MCKLRDDTLEDHLPFVLCFSVVTALFPHSKVILACRMCQNYTH